MARPFLGKPGWLALKHGAEGIDVNFGIGDRPGKNSCSIAGQDASGRIVLRRRVRRDGLIGLTAKMAPCIVAMEACCGAHHIGRAMRDQGHTVRLISPADVRPYV